MLAYDLAYVAYAAAADRTLAPLRGRVRGLRDWSRVRRTGAAERKEVPLGQVQGLRRALAGGALGRRGRRRASEATDGYGSARCAAVSRRRAQPRTRVMGRIGAAGPRRPGCSAGHMRTN